MTENITFPLWLFIILTILALWALIDHLLLPSIRWYFRRRVSIVIKEINKKLDINLPAFQLSERKEIINQLVFDPLVIEATKKFCQEQEAPFEVGLEKVKRYAREIVPSFNAYLYFRIGNWLSRAIVRFIYRIRVGYVDEESLAGVDPNSSVVFIMNHRSNVDYILVAFLAINRVALSFAVGEWARVWPLQQLLRALGAFFVRRGSGNELYRCVLARYVQMATEGGVVQAVFPEGRLSMNGKLGEPKIGLLDYMLRNFDPDKGRDIVFIPVGVNYDRVFEDRSQLLRLESKSKKKSRIGTIKTTMFFLLNNLWLKLRGRWYRLGYAVVNFGTPISVRAYVKSHGFDFRSLGRLERGKKVKKLAEALMGSVGNIIPVVPVSLIAQVFVKNPEKTFSELELKSQVQSLLSHLEEQRAQIYVPRKDRDYAIEVGLRMLILRHMVLEEDKLYRAAKNEIDLLRYYANSIHHLIES
jgi:glycerol-3-phosphate O-acyltransferase